nr:hypothetical protein BgiMline_015599 [Biomphalaria glabrata]
MKLSVRKKIYVTYYVRDKKTLTLGSDFIIQDIWRLITSNCYFSICSYRREHVLVIHMLACLDRCFRHTFRLFKAQLSPLLLTHQEKLKNILQTFGVIVSDNIGLQLSAGSSNL